jgi:hypothetical protein
MTNSRKTYRLYREQAEYLAKLVVEDGSFRGLLHSHPEMRVDGGTVTVNHAEAELLRDYFTDRLAKVGFDADYNPNKEGTILEDLIDTFFLVPRK